MHERGSRSERRHDVLLEPTAEEGFYEATQGDHYAGTNIDEKARTTALEYTYLQRQLM